MVKVQQTADILEFSEIMMIMLSWTNEDWLVCFVALESSPTHFVPLSNAWAASCRSYPSYLVEPIPVTAVKKNAHLALLTGEREREGERAPCAVLASCYVMFLWIVPSLTFLWVGAVADDDSRLRHSPNRRHPAYQIYR